jgi:homoserine O-succinyltransferase
MPLVRNSRLPTFTRLKHEGRIVLEPERVSAQEIRELHIGFLNMMPDAALEATERQFFRLIGESNAIVQIHIHPFTLPVIPRSAETQAYLDTHYETIDQIKADGLDALVITGANAEHGVQDRKNDQYWEPLKDILEWANDNVTSTLCSCLSSHAALTYLYGEPPQWREDKRWGVFRHKVLDSSHPILRGMNTSFDVPHSRNSEISRSQFEKAGMRVLVESPDVGVHMATSADGFRLICFQGHPEYDMFSLLKEYRREVARFISGTRSDYPPFPDNYFSDAAKTIAADYKQAILNGQMELEFPEHDIAAQLENTWTDSARSAIATWIGLVYQTTHVDRKKPFMDGIDPENPLGLL